MQKKKTIFFLIVSIYIQILSSANSSKSICPEPFTQTNRFAIVSIANTFIPHITVIIASIDKYKNNTKVDQTCLSKLVIEVNGLSTSPCVTSNLEQCIGNGFYQIEDVALGACGLLWFIDDDLNLPCLAEPTCWVHVLAKLHNNFSMLQSLYTTPMDLLTDVQRILENCVKYENANIFQNLLKTDWESKIITCLK